MDPLQFNTLIQELSAIGKRKTLQSHTTLVPYQEVSTKVYLILSGGMVLLHVHPKSLEERAINFFIPEFHPLATISNSFYYQQPSDYCLKTFTNTELVEIKKADLDAYLNQAKNGQLLYAYGTETLLQKNEVRAKLISFTSLEMLEYLHNTYPAIIQNIPSKYIANFLGISPQWLSKLKHKL